MFQILVPGDLASSESQARPNSSDPTADTVDLTNEKDKEQDQEEQEEEKEKEQVEKEGQEKENDQEEKVTIEVEVADSPNEADDGNPEEYQDCQEYRADLVPPGPPPGPPPKRTTGGPVPPPGPPPKRTTGKSRAAGTAEPFLEEWGDDDWRDWEWQNRAWWGWKPEKEEEVEEVKEEDPMKEEEVKEDDLMKEEVKEEEQYDEAEGEKDDEHMPGDDASYVSSEEVDGFDLLRDDVM